MKVLVVNCGSSSLKFQFIDSETEKVSVDWNKPYEEMSMEEHMALYEEQGMDHKEAMKAVAKDRGIKKSDIYAEYKLGKCD